MSMLLAHAISTTNTTFGHIIKHQEKQDNNTVIAGLIFTIAYVMMMGP